MKLVLQPLLENAIYYGMEFMDGEGEIHVRGYRKDGDIYLEVEDNGLGMPEEEAAELLNGKERPHKHGSGVGLVNVHSRLKLRFGEGYGLMRECWCRFTFHMFRIRQKPRNSLRAERIII